MQHSPHAHLFQPRAGRHHVKVVASCAIVDDGKVLMVQEGDGYEARRWNLPGGKGGPRESLIATAVRETEEESGYAAAVDTLLGVYRYRHRSGDERLRVVFWAHIIGGDPAKGAKGQEIRDVRWIPLDQLLAMPDAKLAKPHLLRAIFGDLRRGVRLPLSNLRAAG